MFCKGAKPIVRRKEKARILSHNASCRRKKATVGIDTAGIIENKETIRGRFRGKEALVRLLSEKQLQERNY